MPALHRLLSLACLILLAASTIGRGEEADPAKVDALIAKMTPEEKAAQLQSVQFKDLIVDGHLSLEKCQEKMPHGIGEICAFSYTTRLTPPQTKAALIELQDYLRTKTRLGIPGIPHEENITGMPAVGATTYPQMIGMGCTWDPDLLRQNADATRQAMRWIGGRQALSPVLDVHDNAHWGRVEEAFGEEPYVTSMMGLAFIQGLQGSDLRTGIAATAKHFAGYGGDTTNLAHFRDEVLMPPEVAVRIGHIAAVMPAYSLFQNVPCSASQFLLGDVLRKEWGFDGVTISDYFAIKEVQTKYKYAATPEEAAKDCLEAGLDVDLPLGATYSLLPQAMADGTVPTSLVDRAVRDMLMLKLKLGLLDAAPADDAAGSYDLDSPDNRARAYKSACESLVLLKNDGNILPLAKDVHSIAVVGPNADSYYSVLGDYTGQMLGEFWLRMPANPNSPKLITLLAGLKDRVAPDVRISYARGCDWSSPFEHVGGASNQAADLRAAKAQRKPMEAIPPTDAAAALKLAAKSDVIIAAMGENRYLCGEMKDRADVGLPGEQAKFVQQLIATGKPVILVVFGGRPMVLTDVAAGCRAIVYAWYPGQDGGHAVADLLLGRINPSGKLTITLPRSDAQIPISYRAGYSEKDMPLYPFGYGMSYTTYAYSKLQAPATAKTTDAGIPIQFQLTNAGAREGVEISQLYFAPVTPAPGQRPIELKGYGRIDLKPNETKTVTINVSPQQLARHDDVGTLTIEPESYQILVGASSTDIRLRANLDLTGDKVTLPHREQFFSRTTVQ
jgi:beta-glucosidase